MRNNYCQTNELKNKLARAGSQAYSCCAICKESSIKQYWDGRATETSIDSPTLVHVSSKTAAPSSKAIL
eukprot:11950154-Ditylum_brightwellii.AAC.1